VYGQKRQSGRLKIPIFKKNSGVTPPLWTPDSRGGKGTGRQRGKKRRKSGKEMDRKENGDRLPT